MKWAVKDASKIHQSDKKKKGTNFFQQSGLKALMHSKEDNKYYVLSSKAVSTFWKLNKCQQQKGTIGDSQKEADCQINQTWQEHHNVWPKAEHKFLVLKFSKPFTPQ